MIRASKLIISLQFIHFKILELEDINAATRNKPIADHTTLKSLIHYLFVCDEAKFQHERLRVQLALSMLIMAYTAQELEPFWNLPWIEDLYSNGTFTLRPLPLTLKT